jgi:hypothetical protein
MPRDFDRVRTDFDSAAAAREMMQAIRNMYKGHNPKAQAVDRPDWHNTLNENDDKVADFSFKTSATNFRGSESMREAKENLPIFKLRGRLE